MTSPEKASSSPGAAVSVAILTRDRLPLLRRLLGGLLSQIRAGDEIVVVDTGSGDGTREWLATQRVVRTLHLDDPCADFAAARNFAIRHIQNPFIAFLDDDCVPAPDWLERLRAHLNFYDAVAGPVLPAHLYRFPRWWSGELAWAAGMSPLGLLEGRPDSYPATANFAARRNVFELLPFASLPSARSSDRPYLAGREDASWWMNARRMGLRLLVDPKLQVFHSVPPKRFTFENVAQRVQDDGTAAWLREPLPQQLHFEWNRLLDHISDSIARLPTIALANFPEAVARWLWWRRGLAYVRAAVDSGQPRSAAAHQVICRTARRLAGEIRIRAVRALRSPLVVPDPPQHMLVAAPTFLGDTVLLLPVIDMLARNWPQANLVIWTRYPQLFQRHSPLLTVIDTAAANTALIERYAKWSSQLTFVPYYHFGSQRSWRRFLSLRSITFDCDVGFPRLSDYFYASHRVKKRFDQHEIFNLLDLVSLWPLAGPLLPPVLPVSEEALEGVASRFKTLFDEPYVTLHIDSALEMKRWPLESWEIVARRLIDSTGVHCCIIGTERTRKEAQALSQRLGPRIVDMTGLPLEELIAVLSRATMAIGPCSGPKHLAYALRTPTFTIYGAVPEHRWGAWFDHQIHGHISSPVEFLSAREQANLPPNHAMLLLDAEEVAEAALRHFENVRGWCGRSTHPATSAHNPTEKPRA